LGNARAAASAWLVLHDAPVCALLRDRERGVGVSKPGKPTTCESTVGCCWVRIHPTADAAVAFELDLQPA